MLFNCGGGGKCFIMPVIFQMNDELESIFEKMHSEKTGGGAPNESAATEENTVWE